MFRVVRDTGFSSALVRERVAPDGDRSSTVSTIVCHSPQAGHLPRYPGLIAPHCWHIHCVRAFGMVILFQGL
jgi:hypothetical protein